MTLLIEASFHAMNGTNSQVSGITVRQSSLSSLDRPFGREVPSRVDAEIHPMLVLGTDTQEGLCLRSCNSV